MNQRKRHIDLLHGKILPALTGLAIPIMATSMVQTAYNLTDMAWVGRVGSRAVAAVGAAGMYTWLSQGIVTLARMGGQIKVAHSLGEGEPEEAVEYARGALQMTIFLAFLFAVIVQLFAGPMIAYFGMDDPMILRDGERYLRIAGGLILFSFLNQTMTGLFTAIGDSKTPFTANSLGLVANMILDPLLIFGIGPFPRMEAVGAALATVTAQSVVTLVLIWHARKDTVLFRKICLWKRTPVQYVKTILKLGIPSSLQSMLYSGISMVLTRMVAGWGDSAVAVQRVGGQIECISWMTAEGFGSAMNAFTGQNFGAKFYDRMKKGYQVALVTMIGWGTLTSLVMIFGAEWMFRIFIQEAHVLPIGISYLIVLGYGQMPMCVELMTVGALQGMGKTMSCSAITIMLTAIRIPLAYGLSRTSLGLDGIWWALTLTTMAKGILFSLFYFWQLSVLPKMQEV